jgi:hypothetical protein
MTSAASLCHSTRAELTGTPPFSTVLALDLTLPAEGFLWKSREKREEGLSRITELWIPRTHLRISGSPDLRISGSPDLRISGSPDRE